MISPTVMTTYWGRSQRMWTLLGTERVNMLTPISPLSGFYNKTASAKYAFEI